MRTATLDGLHWALAPVSTGGSTELPVSLADVKTALRLSASTDEDDWLAGRIGAAATLLEERTRRRFIQREFDLFVDRAPCGRMLPVPVHPLASVTSIVSFNSTHGETALSTDDYYIDTASIPGRVILNAAASWPSSLREAAGIRVRFVAGHSTDAAGIPDPLSEAMLQTVAFLYEHRGEGAGAFALPPQIDDLIGEFIVPDVV